MLFFILFYFILLLFLYIYLYIFVFLQQTGPTSAMSGTGLLRQILKEGKKNHWATTFKSVEENARTDSEMKEKIVQAEKFIESLSPPKRTERRVSRSQELRSNFVNHEEPGFMSRDEIWGRQESERQRDKMEYLAKMRKNKQLLNALNYSVLAEEGSYMPPFEWRQHNIVGIDHPPDERMKFKIHVHIPLKHLLLTDREKAKLILIAGSRIQKRRVEGARRKSRVLTLSCDDYTDKKYNFLSIVETFRRLIREVKMNKSYLTPSKHDHPLITQWRQRIATRRLELALLKKHADDIARDLESKTNLETYGDKMLD